MPGKLHIAAAEANGLTKVMQLVEAKEDINKSDENKKRPIDYAVKTGGLETVRYLVEEAKVVITDTIALMEAAAKNHIDVRKYIADLALARGEITVLHRDAYIGFAERLVQALRDEPQKIIEQDKSGKDVFYWLWLTGQKRVLSILKKQAAFKSLPILERDKLLRSITPAFLKGVGVHKDSLSDELYSCLQISNFTDEDYRALLELRSIAVRNLLTEVRSMMAGAAYYDSRPVWVTLNDAEIQFEYAFANYIKIKIPTSADAFTLAVSYVDLGDVYLLRQENFYPSRDQVKNFEAAKSACVSAESILVRNVNKTYPSYYFLLARIYKNFAQNNRLLNRFEKARADMEHAISYLHLCPPSDLQSCKEYYRKIVSYCRLLGEYIFNSQQHTVEVLERTVELGLTRDISISMLSDAYSATNLTKAIRLYKLYDNGKHQETVVNCRAQLTKTVQTMDLKKFKSLINEAHYPLDFASRFKMMFVIESEVESLKMPLSTAREFLSLLIPTQESVPLLQSRWWYDFSCGKESVEISAEILADESAFVASLKHCSDILEHVKIVETEMKQELGKPKNNIAWKLCSDRSGTRLWALAEKLQKETSEMKVHSPGAGININAKLAEAKKCYEKALERGCSYHALPANLFLDDTRVTRDMSKALQQAEVIGPETYNSQLDQCMNNYRKVILAGDIDELCVLIDVKKYPLKEVANQLVNFVIEQTSISASTQREILLVFATRGMECPLGVPLARVFEQLRDGLTSAVRTVLTADTGNVVIDYLVGGANHSLWKKVVSPQTVVAEQKRSGVALRT